MKTNEERIDAMVDELIKKMIEIYGVTPILGKKENEKFINDNRFKKMWGDYNVIIGRRDNGKRLARMKYEGKHNEKKVL